MTNINDVARAAGVSRGSVSNYLNGNKVSIRIREKVEQAIAELKYIPNAAARDLRAQDSRFVIFIIPTVWTSFFAELTYHVQEALTAKGFKMILCISNSEFTKEEEYLKLAESQKAAGIISISYSQMNHHVRSGIPLVSIEKEPTGLFPLVSSDNYQGGRLATEKLAELNCRKFIFIGTNRMTSEAMLARRQGFLDYCKEKQLNFEVFDLESPKNRAELRFELENIFKKFKKKKKLDGLGIFAITDEYGLLVYRILLDLKVKIPEQVQLIGFDGSKASQNEEPVLSSIRQPIEQIAAAAVKALKDEIAQGKARQLDEKPNRLYIPVSYIAGKTTRA